jgi:hypothetical protein
MMKDQVSNLDKTKIDIFQKAIQGKEKPDVEGIEVFRYLKEEVMNL